MLHSQPVSQDPAKKHTQLLQHLKKLTSQPTIQKMERETNQILHFPLSASQQRLYLLEQMYSNTSLYNMCNVLDIKGHLQYNVLLTCLHEIIKRQESLRTRFVVRDGTPWQEVLPSCSLELPVHDLSSSPTDQQEQLLHKHLQELIHTPFELSQAPLLRAHLIRLQPQQHVLVLCFHHIISDGWSQEVFLRELTTLYQAFVQGAPSPLAPLACHYADFAQWQRQDLQGERLDGLLAYWRQHLHAAPPLLSLPTDTPRPPQQRYQGALSPFTLSSKLSEQVRQLAHRSNATLFQLSLTAFALLLQRYSGQDDLVIGTALAGRTRQEVEGLIGFFVNTLPLRIRITGNETGRQLLEQVRETVLAASAHQDLPFEKLVESLHPERSLSYHPIFQVACVAHQASFQPFDIADLHITPIEIPAQTSKFDLTLFVGEEEGRMMGAIEYDIDLFEASTIQRLLEHWQVLLHALSATPDSPCWSFPLLSESEVRLQFACPPPQEALPFPPTSSVLAAFATQVRSHPEALAVVTPTEALSYQQLNTQANQLAQVLQGAGIEMEDRVGVCLPRSSQLLVCLLAILKAGGVYVPLDPVYPPQRIQAIVRDAQPRMILCSPPQVAQLAVPATTTLLEIDTLLQYAHTLPPKEPALILHPGQLAYIIYTSGSTGFPKGVMVTHGSLYNLAIAQIIAFGLQSTDRILQFASPSFDASISEIFITLLVGARLYLRSREAILPGKSLERTLLEDQISCITLPPSGLSLLKPDNCPTLRIIISAGEACSPDLAQSWSSGHQFFNAYGPTETTVCATVARGEECLPIRGKRNSAIGRALANAQVYILDRHQQPVPPGVVGEIYIGGAGIARGYLNKPDLTATSFLPDPLNKFPGSLLYRTGDIGTYYPDGRIEFLGRNDRQIKMRGFRIELNAIEALLDAHPLVQKSIVTAYRDENHNSNLIAYIIQNTEMGATVESLRLKLRSYLQERLPEYMVPALYYKIDTLPTTVSGKCDYAKLPAPESFKRTSGEKHIPPQADLEQAIARIWQSVLPVADPGIHDNFFDLGGHSLLIVQVHERLQTQLNLPLSLLDLFRYTTIASIVDHIHAIQGRIEPMPDAKSANLGRDTGKKRLKRQLEARKQVKF